MRYSVALTALLSLTAGALASPVAKGNTLNITPITREEILERLAQRDVSKFEKRTPGGIYLCTEANWHGTCGYAVQPICPGKCSTASQIASACVILTAPYLRNIGSFGPDSGATVYLSSNGDCNEADTSISNPGSADFFNYQNNEGKLITSFLVI